MSVVPIYLRLKSAFLWLNIFTCETRLLRHFTQVLKTSILGQYFWSVVNVRLEIKPIHLLLNLLFFKFLGHFILLIKAIKCWSFRSHDFRFKIDLRLKTKLRWLLLFQKLLFNFLFVKKLILSFNELLGWRH